MENDTASNQSAILNYQHFCSFNCHFIQQEIIRRIKQNHKNQTSIEFDILNQSQIK